MDISGLTELSLEQKGSPVPKLEKEEDVGLLETRTSESSMVEELRNVAEGLMEEEGKGSMKVLTLEEERERVTLAPAVQELQKSPEANLTVKENAFEGLPVEEHTKSDESLVLELQERTAKECNASSESVCVEERRGASEELEVSSAGLTVGECESRAVKEHEKGLTVMENCERSSEDSTVEPPEEMDLDGERSLAKLSSLVEERTSLKPSAVRQPESFHCSVINPQNLSAPGEPSSNVPSATFIPLTPKIGMGKPAISKRKFSPGRPRVKQVGPPPPFFSIILITYESLKVMLGFWSADPLPWSSEGV